MDLDCNYCYKINSNIFGKKYCEDCAGKCFKECLKCHKPFQTQYSYFYSDNLCNKCFLKHQKLQLKIKQIPVKQKHLHYSDG